jgi:hypothetical protein
MLKVWSINSFLVLGTPNSSALLRFTMAHKFSMGLRSGDWGGQLSGVMPFQAINAIDFFAL